MVQVITLNTLDLGKTMTIAVWFRINNFSSYQKIFDFSNVLKIK